VATGKFPYKGSLLKGVPSLPTAGREHPEQGLIFPATPVFDNDRIPFAQLERRHPPVTIDEHTRIDGDNGRDLPPLLKGGGKADQGLFFHNPGVSVSKLQVCDLHFPGFYCDHLFSIHARQAVHLQNLPGAHHRRASRMI